MIVADREGATSLPFLPHLVPSAVPKAFVMNNTIGKAGDLYGYY